MPSLHPESRRCACLCERHSTRKNNYPPTQEVLDSLKPQTPPDTQPQTSCFLMDFHEYFAGFRNSTCGRRKHGYFACLEPFYC